MRHSTVYGNRYNGIVMQRLSHFRIITSVLLGLSISLAYSLLSSVLLYVFDGKSEVQLFLVAYNASFKTLLSLGLILGAAMVVLRSQNVIPETIERAFTSAQLAATDYSSCKQRFLNKKRSIASAAEFCVVGFLIFSLCKFPLRGRAEALMIIPACVQYALGVYVGRKLYYACRMLHSVLDISVARGLLNERERDLDEAYVYVHMLSALTIIFLCVHIIGYSSGPFLYKGVPGAIASTFLTLPPLIAMAVLLALNFYARGVLQELHGQSIDVEEVKPLRGRLSQLQDDSVVGTAKRFRVAVSFAGEKRNYVAKIATMLADRFGEAAILYDKFHEAEFARRDLGFYLPDLYQKESDLVIVVVCSDYNEKEWCGLEWDAIFELLKRRKNEDVMLCRFDHALVRGLYSTAGFLELDDVTAEQATTRILERLALNEGRPKEYYLSGAGVREGAIRKLDSP